MKKLRMILAVIFVLSMVLMVALAQAAPKNEEYVLVNNMTTLPFFVNHDNAAGVLAAKELGVKFKVVGPSDNNMDQMVAALDQTIARKPAGIMVIGWNESALIPGINKAIAAGIPTICIDADVPASKRLAFIGTNWSELGRKLGEAIVDATNGKGKIAMLGLIGLDNMDRAYAAFKAVIAKHPDMKVITLEDDKGDEMEAARVAAAVMQANPDLAGFAGFDAGSGAGIGRAIIEAKKIGKVKLVMNNAEPQQLKLVKDGVAQFCLGQKREFFTYYGVKLLYDVRHSRVKFSKNDAKAGVSKIPVNIETGFLDVSSKNIDLFLK